MEITLHIGAHRTGTTRLQGALRRQRAQMAAEGVFFAAPPGLRARHNAGLSLAARLPLPGFRPQAVQRAGTALYEAQAQGFARAVLSEEDYAGAIDDMLRTGQPYRHIGARLRQFTPLLQGHEVQICFAVRHYADWFRSLYAHRVTRRPLKPFAEYGARFREGGRGWDAVISDISAALPQARVTVWAYESMIGRVSEAMRLISGVAGVSDPLSARPPALATPSAEAIEVLNRTPRRRDDKQDRLDLAARLTGGERAGFNPWSDADHDLLSKRYEKDLARIVNLPRVQTIDLSAGLAS